MLPDREVRLLRSASLRDIPTVDPSGQPYIGYPHVRISLASGSPLQQHCPRAARPLLCRRKERQFRLLSCPSPAPASSSGNRRQHRKSLELLPPKSDTVPCCLPSDTVPCCLHCTRARRDAISLTV